MDIEQVENIIREYGIPSNNEDIIRIIREAHGVDVRSHVIPPQTGAQQNRCSFPHNTERFRDYYREYRAARRMSTPIFYNRDTESYCGILSVYRSSSPRGILTDNIYSTVNLCQVKLGEMGLTEAPMPVIIDQNTRWDCNPGQHPDGMEHLRIQLITTSRRAVIGSGVDRTINGSAFYEYAMPESDREAYQANINQLTVNGWELICYDDTDIPWGAILPDTNNAIIFGSPRDRGSGHSYVIFMMKEWARRFWMNTEQAAEAEDPTAPTAEHLQLADHMRMLIGISSSMNSRVSDLRQSIESNRTQVNTYTELLANALRAIDDDAQALESLERDLPGQVIERVRATTLIADQANSMRPVASAEVTTDFKLQIITHPYGMTRPGNNANPVLIKPLMIQIDLLGEHFQRSTKIKAYEVNANTSFVHPHLNPPYNDQRGWQTICWGEAARLPLPDAWARRDWLSYLRMIFGWVTQYNAASPYYPWRDMQVNFERAPRPGWLIPAEGTPRPEPVEMDQTIDIGASGISDFASSVASSVLSARLTR